MKSCPERPLPDWSADGHSIVFVRHDQNAIELWQLDVDSGATNQLTASNALNLEPRYAPDGKRLAYVSTAGTGHARLGPAQPVVAPRASSARSARHDRIPAGCTRGLRGEGAVKAIISALATLAIALPAWAETVLVHAGRVIDVERGRVLTNQAIRIENDRIVSIGDFSGAATGGPVIDWSAYSVVPGLMDMHTHLVGNITSADLAAPLQSSAAQDVLIGVSNARKTVRAGFTTVRDVGCYRAFTDVALRNAINAGVIEGPRMIVVGAYITVSGGGGEVTGLAPDVVVPAEMRRGVANSADEVRQRVRELIAGGATFIKVIATGAVLTAGTNPGASEYSEAEIRAAVEEAAQYGIFVAAHAHGAEGIKRAVRAGVRSVEHASYLDDEGIALMKRNGTWLVADIYNGDYIDEVGHRDHWTEEVLRKNTETTQRQRDGFAKAAKAGVRIAFGTDSGVYPHGDNAKQFAYMVRYGLTPLDAIRSATLNAAQLLGMERDIGSIAPGKFADLVAVDGDPLQDIEKLRAVRAVMKAGRLISRE